MLKLLTPNAVFNSIFDISPDFFIEKGIKALFLDIDNTLVTPHTAVPDGKALSFMQEFISAGLVLCLVSNNKKERVERFNTLSLKSVHRAAKPFPHSYRRLVKELGILPGQAAAIGDQLFSDISGGNAAGLFTVYVRPIKIGGEGGFVWLKRKAEIPVIKKLGL